MTRVVAIILHPVSAPDAGPLTSLYSAMREACAERHERSFRAAGAEARIVEVEVGGAPFGARLRQLLASDADSGLVILGSGSIPLATAADRRALVRAAAAKGGPVLTNNRYSADVIALPAGTDLASLPDIDADNALPRWLEEHGVVVDDRVSRRLQFDLDSPLDGIVARLPAPDDLTSRARDAIVRVRSVAGDGSKELLVAGRTSTRVLRWLERNTASRTRALVEERGMRTARRDQRPARSTLGLLLDDRGPAAFGRLLGELGDGAVVDTRVLLAHTLGNDERAWPAAEDRFASDLLLPDRIADPWLRELTRSAVDAEIPVLLGGHSLVGPGLPILLRRET